MQDNHVDLKLIAMIYVFVFFVAFATQIALDMNAAP